MTKCWYRLDIDTTNALKIDLKVPEEDRSFWYYSANKIFTEEWLEYMETKGLKIKYAMVFYKAANASSNFAHIDVTKSDKSNIDQHLCNFAINWTIGGAGSEMVWYDEPISSGVMRNDLNGMYKNWGFDELTEVDRTPIGSEVTLVQVNIPHSIKMGNEPRWSISARTSNDDDIPWKNIVESMRSKNLLLE